MTATILQSEARGDDAMNFTRDVRPILSDNCFRCHGPDENTREADLRLDQRENLFAELNGNKVVTAGHPDSSELIRRILSDDPDEMMPPPDSNKSLTNEQKQRLVDWVKQGSPWEQHWSFVKPVKPPVPTADDDNWSRNEIDRFIFARQQSVGLTPSAAAPPATLIRRLYLDLTGLPPTPEEANHWIGRIWDTADTANEAAYGELIDQLMQSPAYGERWARRWLDLARYADTNGYEKDRDRSIWPYRDWVVNAINERMPFDRFTIEQLAGDMLPHATIDQRVATGFHRNTMLNEEGGIDPLEFRYHAMTDRVATTGTTWLGLTLGCCQCHTHKYDPVSHREYFQIMAFLNNADEPSLDLPNSDLDTQWAAKKSKAEQLIDKLPTHWPTETQQVVPTTFLSATANGNQRFHLRDDGVVQVQGENSDAATYVVDIQVAPAEFNALRLTTRALGKRPGPGRTPHGNFVLSEVKMEVVAEDQTTTPLPVTTATASIEQDRFPIGHAIDQNPVSGWAIHKSGEVVKTASATFRVDTSPITVTDNQPLKIRITMSQQYGKQHTIGAFQWQAVRDEAENVEQRRQQAVAAAFAKWRADEEKNAVTWNTLVPQKATSNLPILTIQDDHSIFASGDTAKRDDYRITLSPSETPVHAIRLEALPDSRLPAGGPGSTYYEGTLGDFYLTELRIKSGERVFPISTATETFAKNRFGSRPASAAFAIDNDIQSGWSVHGRQGERHVAVFVLKQPIPTGQPITIEMSFGRHFASSLGRFRFSATDAATVPEARTWSPLVSALLQSADGDLSPDQVAILRREFLLKAPELATHTDKIRNLLKRPAATSTLVMAERTANHPRPTRRHHRGEYLQPKEEVTAGLPSVLASDGGRRPGNRLEFAQWLVSDDNPLTARVVVNRQWATIFGTGIVKTVDDFGLQGESPSHPQLLDWLAVTFRQDDAWSLRKLHRRIVMSSTYRQSSNVNPEASSVDPSNRLLSYSPRYRLDAEVIRDQLLVAAGVLSDKRGGPPVRPLQPQGVTEVAYGAPKWNASSGDDRYRRSLYTFTKRTAPFAMLATFDAPSGEACIATRSRSNSPLQALTLLNDVMLMDLARKAGQRLADEHAGGSHVHQQVVGLFRRVLVREPTDVEVADIVSFFNARKSDFAQHPQQAAELLNTKIDQADQQAVAKAANLAAWTATARATFGLDETLTRE